MALLFNQTNKQLSWSMGGRKFSCAPWESVDIPGDLADACKRRGLPLGVTPVPPETRATRRVEESKQAASNDELTALKAQIKDAKAEAASSSEFAAKQQRATESLTQKLRETQAENARLREQLSSVTADKKAAEDLLSDTAKQATHAEERALKAEAVLNERKSKKSHQSRS